MPSRASTSFLHGKNTQQNRRENIVSMPSRAVTSFLQVDTLAEAEVQKIRVNALSGCYLISTGLAAALAVLSANPVSMPSRADTSFLLDPIAKRIKDSWDVSMPSRADTSFLLYPFKNLGFMRFPEPVFADIYQNILTITVFRAC